MALSNKLQHILGWIFFIPLAITLYVATKLCVTWTFTYINSEMVFTINSISDFGEYHILGPIFLFIRESAAVCLGIYSGVYLAPNHKFLVLLSFEIICMLIVLIIAYFLGLALFTMIQNTEVLLRISIEMLSVITGVVACILYISKEQKEIYN